MLIAPGELWKITGKFPPVSWPLTHSRMINRNYPGVYCTSTAAHWRLLINSAHFNHAAAFLVTNATTKKMQNSSSAPCSRKRTFHSWINFRMTQPQYRECPVSMRPPPRWCSLTSLSTSLSIIHRHFIKILHPSEIYIGQESVKQLIDQLSKP